MRIYTDKKECISREGEKIKMPKRFPGLKERDTLPGRLPSTWDNAGFGSEPPKREATLQNWGHPLNP